MKSSVPRKPALAVRAARPGDYEALCALWRVADDLHAAILPAYFRSTRRPARRRDELERLLRAPGEAVLVAEAGGVVTGLVHVQIYDTPPVATMVPRRRAHVDSLIVDPDVRRRGVGRGLLEAAATWARGKGAEDLLLTVWDGNAGAEDFYRALGFRRVNTVLARPL